MMRMTNTMFGSVKSVLMDSGFCVLKGVVGVLEYGVYGATVIKKIYILAQLLQGRFH